MRSATLGKSQIVSGKNNISRLLDEGHWGSCQFIKYCYAARPAHVSAPDGCQTSCRVQGRTRIMVSVSKRFFKRAVKRNLLKRRIRESFRLSQNLLDGCSCDILWVYNSKEIMSSELILSAIQTALVRIHDDLVKAGAASTTADHENAAE